MASREQPPEDPERRDDDRLEHEDAHVRPGHGRISFRPLDVLRSTFVVHSAALRDASVSSALTSASVAAVHHAWSASSSACEHFAARSVSSGAGPPWVARTLMKWRGLRICVNCASEYASGAPSTSVEASIIKA